MASEAFSLLAVLLVGRAAHKMGDKLVRVWKWCSKYLFKVNKPRIGWKEASSAAASVETHTGNSHIIMERCSYSWLIPHARKTDVHIIRIINLSFLAEYSFWFVLKRPSHFKNLSTCRIPPEYSLLFGIHRGEVRWEMDVEKLRAVLGLPGCLMQIQVSDVKGTPERDSIMLMNGHTCDKWWLNIEYVEYTLNIEIWLWKSHKSHMSLSPGTKLRVAESQSKCYSSIQRYRVHGGWEKWSVHHKL